MLECSGYTILCNVMLLLYKNKTNLYEGQLGHRGYSDQVDNVKYLSD